jgi:hypothetical protein
MMEGVNYNQLTFTKEIIGTPKKSTIEVGVIEDVAKLLLEFVAYGNDDIHNTLFRTGMLRGLIEKELKGEILYRFLNKFCEMNFETLNNVLGDIAHGRMTAKEVLLAVTKTDMTYHEYTRNKGIMEELHKWK